MLWMLVSTTSQNVKTYSRKHITSELYSSFKVGFKNAQQVADETRNTARKPGAGSPLRGVSDWPPELGLCTPAQTATWAHVWP